MTIAEQKAAQRKAGIAARRALSEVDRTSANAALCARIAGLDCFRTAQNILLYAAFGGEADLSALSGQAAAQGKTLAWPVCGEGFSLTAAVPEANGWEVGAYGIRTPVLRRCPAQLSTPPAAGWAWGRATTTAIFPAAPGL